MLSRAYLVICCTKIVGHGSDSGLAELVDGAIADPHSAIGLAPKSEAPGPFLIDFAS